ncbi:hypothetical protein EYF80_011777 [Liparis tanakae]|uniref:Uncharacterized protein n=1 Tax=Liparis tanakae TaxID=230148 RepID=A0A4Z2ILH2_9TELE|nr:hypothetical protein EYF80_011777 [Liparis tanakae]
MISLKLAILRLYRDRLGSGDSYTQVCEWQSEEEEKEEEEEEEEERWSGPCERLIYQVSPDSASSQKEASEAENNGRKEIEQGRRKREQ